MKKKKLSPGIFFLAAFALWTTALCLIDVKPIGPENSSVGFSILNGWFHRLAGVHMTLYILTDWLSLIPLGLVFGFGLLGLVQWIRRRSFKKVDSSILILGGFYVIVLLIYILFEIFVLNYRPVLIDGILEASYPSSTTMLTICVMITALMQLHNRVRKPALKTCITVMILCFTAFMVIGRLLSGVHWLTDIVGGILLSTGLVLLYDSMVHMTQKTDL